GTCCDAVGHRMVERGKTFRERVIARGCEEVAMAVLSYADVRKLVDGNNKSTLSTDLLVCLIWKESGFDPQDRNRRSSATGLMQMTNGAVQDVNRNTPKGVHFEHSEMTDPAKNIQCGTYYLQMRIDRAGG